MKNKEFYNHKDVMEILNRSKDFAYKTIRKLNKELEEKGINTTIGRVNAKYFRERFGLD